MFSLNNLMITRSRGRRDGMSRRHLEMKHTAEVNISAKPFLRQRNDSACECKKKKKKKVKRESKGRERGHSVLISSLAP